jgi:hypothetical protein
MGFLCKKRHVGSRIEEADFRLKMGNFLTFSMSY